MKYLVLSCSLNNESKSRVLAEEALRLLNERKAAVDYLDLRTISLPFCDGDSVYKQESVARLTKRVENADAILIATPIYNYDVGSGLKNLIELTDKAWEGKVVGFFCAAGGNKGYMAVMSIANSLMLDFRTFILPRFVYATENDVDLEKRMIKSPPIKERIEEMVNECVRVTEALRG